MPQENLHFEELDQVLHNAQLRRSADLGHWLRQYFEDHRRARSQKDTPKRDPITTLQRPAT